ncbi:alpha/beta fold hydrolase [Thalassococcus arenae]|nr:alpha/beta hydrolase [Thalassococcus arenae]
MLTYIAIAALGFSGLTLWRAQANEARAVAEYPPLGDFVEVDGQAVHYTVTGSGPDLVLIHGASGNLRDMTFALAETLARDYRVIAFDRPGLGHTPPTDDMSITAQAALLAQAAATLGADKPLVVGQSYGGAVALAWGVTQPDSVAALVLLGAPSLPWSSDLSTLYKVNSHPVLSRLTVPLLAAWVPESYVQNAIQGVFAPQSAPDGYADFVGAPLTLRRSALRANAVQRANLLAEIVDLNRRYEDITAPIELVHGDADTTVGLRIHSAPLAERLDGAALDALPGIGHMPHHVARDATLAAIDRAASRAGLR